jgi:hypothetical protein
MDGDWDNVMRMKEECNDDIFHGGVLVLGWTYMSMFGCGVCQTKRRGRANMQDGTNLNKRRIL